MTERRERLEQGVTYAYAVGDGIQLRVGKSRLVNGRFALTLFYPQKSPEEALVGVLRNESAAVALVAFLDALTESVQVAINHHTHHDAKDQGHDPGPTGA